MRFVPQRRAILPHPSFKKWSEPLSFFAFWLAKVLLATAACNFPTSQLQKVVRTWCVFCIWTCKCASRYSSVQFFDIANSKMVRTWCVLCVQFFDIATSKSGPGVCFVHFELQMCFAPQWRAISPYANFQKVVREWCVLYIILTWKCSGVQFFICPLATWLRARRFSEPTVGPSRPTNHWKNTAVCVTFRAPVSSFYWLFSHLSIFFLLTLLLCSAFQRSVLSTWGERSDHHYLDYSMHHSYCVPSIQSVYSHKSSDLRKEALSSYVKFRCTQTVEWISNDLKVSSSRAVKRTSSFCKYSAFFPCARCKQQSGAYWQGLVPHTPRQSFIAKFVYKQSNPHNKNGTTDFWFNLHPGKLTWT